MLWRIWGEILRQFGDAWQALPVRGDTRVFENMLLRDPRVAVKLNVDFFDARAGGLCYTILAI